MDAMHASHETMDNADAESKSVMFSNAEKFFAEARKRMEIRLQRIRGEEVVAEAKSFQATNDYSRI